MRVPPRAAVVDPWGGGALLAPAFRRRGWECIAVHSGPETSSRLGAATRSEDFAAMLDHGGDLAATAERLRRHGVGLVVAGCETGVLLADVLSAELDLPGNGLALSPARRDKARMAQAAAAHGVAVPRQTVTREVEEALAWIASACGYPVVVKPPASLDSDGVAPCISGEQVRAAFAALLGRRNRAGLLNEQAIVQELLDGNQYAVDTVSRDGQHLLAGIWRYSRPRQRPILADGPMIRPADGIRVPCADEAAGRPADRLTNPEENERATLPAGGTSDECLRAYAAIGSDGKQMIPTGDERAPCLFEAACRVLDALGIRLGPAHCELIWTEGGPVLIEIGARLHGGEKTPIVSRLCTGSSQLDRSLDAWLDPDRFAAALGRPYPMHQHGAMVYLMPWRAGHLRGYPRLRQLLQLPSFVELFNLAPPGPLTRRVLGLAILVHPDPSILRRDIDTIRTLEHDGLYQIDPLP